MRSQILAPSINGGKLFIIFCSTSQEVTVVQPNDEYCQAASKYIENQAAQYRSMKGEMIEKYNGLYILFEDGKVLFADQDISEVSKFAHQSSRKHIFIEKVSEEEVSSMVLAPIA